MQSVLQIEAKLSGISLNDDAAAHKVQHYFLLLAKVQAMDPTQASYIGDGFYQPAHDPYHGAQPGGSESESHWQ